MAAPIRVLRLLAAVLAGAGTCFGLSSCANAKRAEPPSEVRVFRCDGDIGFVAQLQGEQAVIATRSHRYELKARRSSFGVRYGSDEVAFAQDEERAVLIGAADGPYGNCVQDEAAA